MKNNMGMIDRGLRILAAIAIFILFMGNVFSGVIATILLIIAAVLLLTSFVGFCPAYLPFGLNTCERRGKRRKK
jgi:hypothetical protein